MDYSVLITNSVYIMPGLQLTGIYISYDSMLDKNHKVKQPIYFLVRPH